MELKLYKKDNLRAIIDGQSFSAESALQSVCKNLVEKGFSNSDFVIEQSKKLKDLIASVQIADDSFLYAVEPELVGRGGSSKCYKARYNSEKLIIKEFFPKYLDSIDAIEVVFLKNIDGYFWWIKDDVTDDLRNRFLMQFVRYVLQSDEIKKAEEKNEDSGIMFFSPVLYFSSRGFIYMSNEFKGETLKDVFTQSECDTVDEIKRRISIIIEAAQNIRDYCHNADIYHGDIKPENIFCIKPEPNKTLIRNIDFDTWLSKEKISKNYLDLMATTTDYYDYDYKHIFRSLNIEDWFKYDIRALSHMLMYALTGSNVEEAKRHYKETHDGNMNWVDFFFNGYDVTKEIPAKKIFSILNGDTNIGLASLYILNQLKSLIFNCSKRTNTAWVERYLGQSYVDIICFINKLQEIELLLKIYSGDHSVTISENTIRYYGLRRLDNERGKKPLSIDYDKLKERLSQNWVAVAIERNYYRQNIDDSDKIDRRLIPDIKCGNGKNDIVQYDFKRNMSPLEIVLSEKVPAKNLFITAEGGQGKTTTLRSFWLDFLSGKHNISCLYIDLRMLDAEDGENAIHKFIYNNSKGYNLSFNDAKCKPILLLDGANEADSDLRDEIIVNKRGTGKCQLVKECEFLIASDFRVIIGCRSNTITIFNHAADIQMEGEFRDNIKYIDICRLRDWQIEQCLDKYSVVQNKRSMIDLLKNNMMLHIFMDVSRIHGEMQLVDFKVGELLDKYFNISFMAKYIKFACNFNESEAEVYEYICDIRKNQDDPKTARMSRAINDKLPHFNKIYKYFIEKSVESYFKTDDVIFNELEEEADILCMLSLLKKIDDNTYTWANEIYQEYFKAKSIVVVINKIMNDAQFALWQYFDWASRIRLPSLLSKFDFLAIVGDMLNYSDQDFETVINILNRCYSKKDEVHCSSSPRLRDGFFGYSEGKDFLYWSKFRDLIVILSVLSTGKIPKKLRYIANSLFSGCVDIKTIVIPNDVVVIGAHAFSGCTNLRSILISNGAKKICERAFEKCEKLEEVELPKSINSIEANPFYNCISLKRIIIDANSKHFFVKNNCLIEIKSKTLICGFDNPQIPDDGSVEIVAECACWGMITKDCLFIPDAIISIGEGAFSDCGTIAHIDVGKSNSRYCSINNCIIDRRNKSIVFACKNSEIPINENIKKIECYAFTGITDCIEITLPDTIVNIDSGFYGCVGLKRIILPRGITEIYPYAFAECENLESVILNQGLKEINSCAFSNCKRLSSIEIPNSVTYIGVGAFTKCSSLSSITLPKSCHIDSWVFVGCSALEGLCFPNGTENIYERLFEGCSNLKTLTIPEGVSVIWSNSFRSCINLSEVKITGTWNITRGDDNFSIILNFDKNNDVKMIADLLRNTYCDCNWFRQQQDEDGKIYYGSMLGHKYV